MANLKKGDIVVLAATQKHPSKADRGKECVFYIAEGFPIKAFNDSVERGYYTLREATIQEKEYCYWCYESIDKEGADLAGLMHYLEHKKNNP